MKVLVMSDIHGDYDSFKKVINNEDFDRLVILGDLLPYSYDYEDNLEDKILGLISKYKSRLILIKGNCDYFLNYDGYNLYSHDEFSITINNHVVTFTHGDRYNKGFLPKYHGDIFMSGHTHIPLISKENDIIYCNPGSIGKPRGGSSKSYLVFENNKLIIKDIDKNIIKKFYIS